VTVSACLVDVYDTILNSDFTARVRALTAFAGVDAGRWLQEWGKTGDERGRGELNMADSFARTLLACGIEPAPGLVRELVRRDAELLLHSTSVYDDTAEFFAALRARRIRSALVSNCSETTRPLLEQLGLTPLADAVILSFEVGSLKPSPEIYLSALDELGVAPADAVMIDDQARFCAGAQAVGASAIQIARADLGKPVADSGFPLVRTLPEALEALEELAALGASGGPGALGLLDG
jgi:putative hydrolase of the HAD superfamily